MQPAPWAGDGPSVRRALWPPVLAATLSGPCRCDHEPCPLIHPRPRRTAAQSMGRSMRGGMERHRRLDCGHRPGRPAPTDAQPLAGRLATEGSLRPRPERLGPAHPPCSRHKAVDAQTQRRAMHRLHGRTPRGRRLAPRGATCTARLYRRQIHSRQHSGSGVCGEDRHPRNARRVMAPAPQPQPIAVTNRRAAAEEPPPAAAAHPPAAAARYHALCTTGCIGQAASPSGGIPCGARRRRREAASPAPRATPLMDTSWRVSESLAPHHLRTQHLRHTLLGHRAAGRSGALAPTGVGVPAGAGAPLPQRTARPLRRE